MQMPREIGTFHIIGIGGIGMSAIAEILLEKGYSVQGSDQKDSANVRRLRTKGVRIFIGHDQVNLVDGPVDRDAGGRRPLHRHDPDLGEAAQ